MHVHVHSQILLSKLSTHTVTVQCSPATTCTFSGLHAIGCNEKAWGQVHVHVLLQVVPCTCTCN